MQLDFKQLEVGMNFMYVGNWIHLKGAKVEIRKKRVGIQMVEIHFNTGDQMLCDARFLNKNFVQIEYVEKKPKKEAIQLDIGTLMDAALIARDYEWCKQLWEVEYGNG